MRVYLGDFGLTRILTGTVSTRTSTNGGTPGFQAPEVLQSGCVTTSCDVYALGCVFIELFGGTPVWGKLPLLTILTNVAVKGRAPQSDHILPLSVRTVCNDCVQ